MPPDRLARVVEGPEQARQRLAGQPARLVGLGPLDVGIGAQRGDRGGAVAAGADHFRIREREVALGADAGVRALGAGEPSVAQDDVSSPTSARAAAGGTAAAASTAAQRVSMRRPMDPGRSTPGGRS